MVSAVDSLILIGEDNTITLNWIAPFTLDISLINNDITYCVDVINSMTSALLHSECEIIGIEFIYSLPPRSWCNEYNFVVTPVNLAGNGTTNGVVYSLNISSRFKQN